ncbi:MAG: hypothetical protein AAGD28_02900 [Bacteroidota bacterium]
MKSHLLLLFIACAILSAQAQNYRYLSYSIRSLGQANKAFPEENRFNNAQISFEQLRPGLALGAGLGTHLNKTRIRFQADIGLSYNLHSNDQLLSALNQIDESISLTTIRRKYSSFQLELCPSFIYPIGKSPFEIRLGYRMSLQSYSYGELDYIRTTNDFIPPDRIGNPISEDIRFQQDFANWNGKLFNWIEFGTKYWFNDYQDLGLEVFASISPSVFGGDGRLYSYLFGVSLVQKWNRPLKE